MRTQKRVPARGEQAGQKARLNKPASNSSVRRLPIGAEVLPGGGVHFRLWAPKQKAVTVEISCDAKLPASTTRKVKLQAESEGYFSAFIADANAGWFYKFALREGSFPDPASRFQPEGPHGASQIIDPGQFKWRDSSWRGVPRQNRVIYEMHIGTFTPEGTWAAAQAELPELARLGITVLEVMPVADFPGRFGWGYDGVSMFAPTRLYGKPDDFRSFVDQAHSLGMGVILDVVYNHLGPDGNYLKNFSEHYFTSRHQNDWGEAINFDDKDSGPVREFFSSNAAYWIDEFHLDGLRLDATQQMFDASAEHILALIACRVRAAGGSRMTYLVAENEPQHARLVRPPTAGGYGLDALWNDDFHHTAFVASTGRSEAYFSDYRGSPQEFISAMKWGHLYQGQWYTWQKKSRGAPAFDIVPSQFVNFLENHDQVANSLRGLRLRQMTSPGQLRALTALLLLGPGTPMLFQGQEFGSSAPFLYFADHRPGLARIVAQGRRDFLRQFPSIASAEADAYLDNPESEQTFRRCKLKLQEREAHPEIYALHRDLLQLRRVDPVFSQPRPGGLDGAVLGPEAFVLRYFAQQNNDRLLLVNLGLNLHLEPIPEPLLAPLEGHSWALEWSSECPRYGGCATPPIDTEKTWKIPGHCAVVLMANPLQ
jgi:maltooligosyltrehalose trehalohydrolase